MSESLHEEVAINGPVDVGSASIGFLIVSAALVFVMTPGVGIFPLSLNLSGMFYAGMVRSKNALTLMFACLLVCHST
jgi:ammonia channel protein AmtB